MHIQYICLVGGTRSFIAAALSRKIDPSMDFSNSGVIAASYLELNELSRVRYIIRTALELVRNPDNDFDYDSGDEIRSGVESCIVDLDLENFDERWFTKYASYNAWMREGLRHLIQSFLAPNERTLRNKVLETYGANGDREFVQTGVDQSVDIYLGMRKGHVTRAREILGENVQLTTISEFSGIELAEPCDNLFAVASVQPYLEYARQLYEHVLPAVISKAQAK